MADDYRAQLAEDAALWSVGEVTTAELIMSACEALVSGLDSQALRELAGLSPSTSTSAYDVEDLLERVADDFAFTFFARNSQEARMAGARILAAQCVAGTLPPRELARWMHVHIKHGHPDERVEELVSLDDAYDTVEYTKAPSKHVDDAVLAAAARLVAAD